MSLAFALSAHAAPTAARVRVMTLNIWNYNGPWDKRLPLIAACINGAAPDVVGLQEIRLDEDRSPLDQAQQIGALLRHQYQRLYQPAMVYSRQPLRQEGLAIFSRLPIARWDAVELSRDAADEADWHQRILLRAQIQTPAGPLHFFNTHWSLSEQGRQRNAAEVSAVLAQFVGKAPVVLVGDLNTTPDGAPAKMMFQQELPPSGETVAAAREASAGGPLLCDLWAHLHPSRPGFTCKSDQPSIRIDYVGYNFADGRFGRPLEVRLACDAPTQGLFPSDHLGIVAEVELKA